MSCELFDRNIRGCVDTASYAIEFLEAIEVVGMGIGSMPAEMRKSLSHVASDHSSLLPPYLLLGPPLGGRPVAPTADNSELVIMGSIRLLEANNGSL